MNADEPVFVDSNVFVYAVSVDSPAKQARAVQWLSALWNSGAGRLSWQVLIEFYVNAVRKAETPKASVREYIDRVAVWKPVDTNLALLHRAWYWADKAGVSWWDALIIAAADHGGCRWLLTEDLQAGQQFDSVTVVNPFETSPEELNLQPLDRPPHTGRSRHR